MGCASAPTGGAGTPNATDRRSYHRLVDAGGKVHDGDHPISANAPGKKLVSGAYAAHTAGLNTGSIGLSMCAMAGATWSDPQGSTQHFPTSAQVSAFVREAARLCRVYGISPTRETVLTHAEVQPTLGVKQKSKWDFDYDPAGNADSRDPIEIGDELREKIRAEIARQAQDGRPTTQLPPSRILRRGDKGDDVRALQSRLLHLGHDPRGVDGAFGPGTYAAVIAFQKASQLRPDGVAGPVTLEALEL